MSAFSIIIDSFGLGAGAGMIVVVVPVTALVLLETYRMGWRSQ
jgi:hypothetical protein